MLAFTKGIFQEPFEIFTDLIITLLEVPQISPKALQGLMVMKRLLQNIK